MEKLLKYAEKTLGIILITSSIGLSGCNTTYTCPKEKIAVSIPIEYTSPNNYNKAFKYRLCACVDKEGKTDVIQVFRFDSLGLFPNLEMQLSGSDAQESLDKAVNDAKKRINSEYPL